MMVLASLFEFTAVNWEMSFNCLWVKQVTWGV